MLPIGVAYSGFSSKILGVVCFTTRLINEALTADERGDKQTAILTYQKALQKLSNGILSSKGSEPRVKEMKQKMERCDPFLL